MTDRSVALVFESFQLLDLSGPLAVFEIADAMTGGSHSVQIVAARPGTVRSSCGVVVAAEPFGDAETVDTLIVVGGAGMAAAASDAAVLGFVAECAQAGCRIASVCTGAFILAAAGILDGVAATTHWSCAQELARRFPLVDVQPDRIYTRSDRVWTSAGISAGIDLALAMIAEDYGEKVARATAQELVIPLRRLGGQSQFSTMLALQHPEGRFTELLHAIRSDLPGKHDVAALAAHVSMSARNFARAFAAETGTTPAKAVERLRCEAARALLDAGAAVKETARGCGFGDIERMRRAFRRNFGAAPATFRL